MEARDAQTIAQFIALNQPARLARVLRGAAELAAAGPAGRKASLAVLCELNDGFYALRMTRAAVASGWHYPPAANTEHLFRVAGAL